MSSITQQVFASSLFNLLSKFLQKGIGIISTLILARVLIPEDFGIVAFLSITINFFTLLSESGCAQYVISKKDLDDEDLNTSWTINFLLRLTLFGLLLLAAPSIANYFNMPEALSALYFVSLILLIRALHNPGFYTYQKNLNYKPNFKLQITAKVLSFVVVMTVIFFEPSYWAMIIGNIISVLVVTVGSYLLHPFRPKPSLVKFKEQWGFSKWMFSKGVLGFFKSNSDQLFITKFFSTSQLGGYFMAKDFTLMPATELVQPATGPLLASFSKTTDHRENFSYQLTLTLFIVNVIALPLAAYIYLFAPFIVHVFLGDTWLYIHPLFSNFAILMYFLCISPILVNAFTAVHKVKTVFYLDLMSTCIVISMLYLLRNSSIELIALSRSLIEGVLVLGFIVYIRTFIDFSFKYLLLLSSPLILAVMLTMFFSNMIIDWQATDSLVKLILYSSSFFIMFLATVYFLFRIYFKKYVEYLHLERIIKIAIQAVLPNNREAEKKQ